MKNIHVLPTDNPSRLHYYSNVTYGVSKEHLNWKQGRHIYITSDEEIKEGDWYLFPLFKKGYSLKQYNSEQHFNEEPCITLANLKAKKIILTTDQDLISKTCVHNFVNIINDGFKCTKCKKQVLRSKITVSDTIDGVQAIDDEFLEWFVKNPSCEEIEIKHKDIIQYGNMTMYDHNGDGSHYFCKDCEVETSRSKEELLNFGVEYYKIIIPKEEPKDVVLGYKTSLEAQMLDKLEPKQETIEEAAEKLILEYELGNTGKIDTEDAKEMLIEFAKYQAERMYNEEEVFAIITRMDIEGGVGDNCGPVTREKWFEKFKKK
jgi:hypothetical protein